MKKIAELRRHILAADSLKVNAQQVVIFAVNGSPILPRGGGANASFIIRYTAMVIISDFTGDTCALFYALHNWMEKDKPDAPAENAYTFDVDYKSARACDVEIKIPLEERFCVSSDGVTVEITPQDEPPLSVLEGDLSEVIGDVGTTWGTVTNG